MGASFPVEFEEVVFLVGVSVKITSRARAHTNTHTKKEVDLKKKTGNKCVLSIPHESAG